MKSAITSIPKTKKQFRQLASMAEVLKLQRDDLQKQTLKKIEFKETLVNSLSVFESERALSIQSQQICRKMDSLFWERDTSASRERLFKVQRVLYKLSVRLRKNSEKYAELKKSDAGAFELRNKLTREIEELHAKTMSFHSEFMTIRHAMDATPLRFRT